MQLNLFNNFLSSTHVKFVLKTIEVEVLINMLLNNSISPTYENMKTFHIGVDCPKGSLQC